MEFPAFVSALKAFYQDNDQPLRLKPKTTEADIAAAEQELGFEIDPALKAAWLAANGGPSYKPVFARQGYLTGYDFLPLQDALKQWRGLPAAPRYAGYGSPRRATADPGRLVPGRLAALRRVFRANPDADAGPHAHGARQAGADHRLHARSGFHRLRVRGLPHLLAQTLEQIEEDPEDFLEG